MVMASLPQESKRFYLKRYQAEFIATRKKFPAIISAWGTGKDLSALAKVMKLAQESEDNLILVLRREFKDLQDSTINDFESYTGIVVNSEKDALVPVFRADGSKGRPSKIMFRHIEQLNNLQNINLGAFWINQGEELDGPEPFYLLMGRLRRSVKQRTGFLTANANGHNWCWQIWIEKKNEVPDYPCWEATTYDNADVLPADYVESLKKLPERIYKRFVLNDHSIAEGLVWPEFEAEKHTCQSYEIPEPWKDAFALDHGHDHPTAVVFGAVDHDGILIIYAEHWEPGQLISHHAKKIKEIEPRWEGLKKYIDPTCKFKNMQDGSRAYSVIEAYGDYGIYFQPAPMDAEAGINKVGELFKAGKIKIFSDKCPQLIRQIKAWKWKKARMVGTVLEKDQTVNVDEDSCKALTYLVASRFQEYVPPKPRSVDPAMPLAGELLEETDHLSQYQKMMR